MDIELLKQLYLIQSPSGSEKKMRKFVSRKLKEYGCIVNQDRYGNIYATKGNAKLYPALCAHMDEVHLIKETNGRNILETNGILIGYSMNNFCQCGIGADDKNGIFVALKVASVLPAVKIVFTVQEEIGGIGANYVDLSFFDDCMYVLECDRKGSSDLITSASRTSLCSKEFIKDLSFINFEFGYKEESGLLTDVLVFKERGLNISCVNISCGYYFAHTEQEFTILDELENCLNYVLNICCNLTNKAYEHKSNYQDMSYFDKFLACDNCSDLDCQNCKIFI